MRFWIWLNHAVNFWKILQESSSPKSIHIFDRAYRYHADAFGLSIMRAYGCYCALFTKSAHFLAGGRLCTDRAHSLQYLSNSVVIDLCL